MGYRRDLWEVAATHHGVVTLADAEDAGVPSVEVRKLSGRGALLAHGQGVYTHRDVPTTPLTQPATAVALAGPGAFLQRESVFALFDLGQFNPPHIRVGTRRRVRRRLPPWLELENRADIADADLTVHAGIATTTLQRAFQDMRGRIPPHRWESLLAEASRRELMETHEPSEDRR